ncbi:COG complex component [Pleurotus eryngii]|uniref:Conserved oligomeric Golgi complex subunit 2 n=1 Tax=Pleurotus eryngii TaxID=5323 RepID=A0A9P6DL05_PLEER|nr:COG complex component [Pleurotus eryngii]
MSVNPNVGSRKDPYELDRLAEELASRESLQQADHDLPAFVPLVHGNQLLAAEEFNVEEFLLSRTYTSLPDLRSELRDYLATLKDELVKLINDDYEAFISLSTDLKDEGARLEKLKHPLDGLKEQILASKDELSVLQGTIQEKLKRRATLREEKALLHLLLKISESITRLESLLLISQPSDGEDSAMRPAFTSQIEGDRNQGALAKHLSRVASEYIQLLYHTSKARAEKCTFVEEIQWRLDRIQATLSSDLDHFFTAIVTSIVDGTGSNKTSEIDKAKLMADLAECLRAYDMLGLWQGAEEILQKQVVRGFVRKTIFPDALVAPPSPIVPHTPFQGASSTAIPRSPSTPYTAFFPRQPPSFLSQTSVGTVTPHTHLLDDADDPLARLYNQILRFVERDLGRIMEVAERASIVSNADVKPDKSSTDSSTVVDAHPSDGRTRGFRIFSDVIWAELGSTIMDELGTVVFASGKPNEFKKHYDTTQIFIRSLEMLAPSLRSVELMRSHPVFTSFQQRWQLPVYFQMRWKDIVGKLEGSLSTIKIERSTDTSTPFVMSQAAAAWSAVSLCWNSDVYIPELSFRFWRLTLQIISRFKTWLVQSLAMEIPQQSTTADKTAGSVGAPRSNTSQTDASTESTASDEAVLSQYATAISDIKQFRGNVLILWRQSISIMLPEAANEGQTLNAEDALQQSLVALTTLIPSMSSEIVTILSKRCCDALLPVRSIPSQFRAMSNKRMPTEPSYFVPSILRPLKVFFCIGTDEGPGASLKQEYLDAYANVVFDTVTQRYMYYLTAMRKTEESLRRLKKGKKVSYSLFGSSSSGKDDDGKDEARIRNQMVLDVEAFGKDGETLGVRTDRHESFRSLHELVIGPLTEDS